MAEVPTIFVRSLVRPIRPTRDLDALARLTGIFRRMRPRIVHTHSSKAGILGRIAARLAGVPVIIHTIHGYGFNVRLRDGLADPIDDRVLESPIGRSR